MNDPWDVKSVRKSGQYVSCMKINGVPLLPPVLSKECHKEMQYYKLLAKEVEKRISLLKPYVLETDTDSGEDKTDAPELPENEESYELPQEQIEEGFNISIEKITAVTKETTYEKTSINAPCVVTSNYHQVTVADPPVSPTTTNSTNKYVIDLSLSINEKGRSVLETLNNNNQNKSPQNELPERDYNCPKNNTKDVITDLESQIKSNKQFSEDTVNFSFSVNKDVLSDPFPDLSINHDGPSSISSKSFTGSLIDIHTECLKEAQINSKLIRQRSYTLLNPSPQLLAHLEVQSLNTGVEMSCISMSESLSNLCSPNKKRRSWDLESAKVKWSSMALELNQKNVSASKVNGVNKNNVTKTTPKRPQQPLNLKGKSVSLEKPRRPIAPNKALPKSEPIQKINTKSISPVRNITSNRTISKEPASPKTSSPKKESSSTKAVSTLISESEDPALRVRELYEKIQKQQLIQMANLVEKQKREQMLLQQVFEEQNNLLYKQLKTICPKSPIEVKEAWSETKENSIGPVSLSQLINHKSPDKSEYDSPVTATLTETNNYISHCDDVLKRSKDLSSSIKKHQPHPRALNHHNGANIPSPRAKMGDNSLRARSPPSRNTSRRLNYDTSSDRECEPTLTDRTNDTMADLNVTFPSDHSDEGQCYQNSTLINQTCNKELTLVHRHPGLLCRSPDHSVNMAETLQNTINSLVRRPGKTSVFGPPTPQQRAAATTIVAFAKGYLVRRLMRSERVQATVQTIRDALVCALQLHQERGRIRGADVDLHRRLIQQITAACYSLHDTFVASTPAERCAMIAADRDRRRSLANRPPPPRQQRQTNIMSQSYSGAFPARSRRPSTASLMTQSNYETFSGDKCGASSHRYVASPRRRPWR